MCHFVAELLSLLSQGRIPACLDSLPFAGADGGFLGGSSVTNSCWCSGAPAGAVPTEVTGGPFERCSDSEGCHNTHLPWDDRGHGRQRLSVFQGQPARWVTEA